jgi:hypothetical protein
VAAVALPTVLVLVALAATEHPAVERKAAALAALAHKT